MQGNEVSVVADEKRSPDVILTKNAAQELTDDIRSDLEDVYLLIMAAYKGQAWKPLGYSTWDDYVTQEFGNLHLRPPRETVTDVIQSLSASGMSIRAIRIATQLGYGTVQRHVTEAKAKAASLEGSGDPLGSPEPARSLGQDGKTYVARRTAPSTPTSSDVVEGQSVADELPDELSVEDVLAMPADAAGIAPLNLEERAKQGRERVSRMLREFHGSGDAALPRTIKLAGQVAGLVSPVTGRSTVPEDDLHNLAYDCAQGVKTLAFVLTTLTGALTTGESGPTIKANLRDSKNELDVVLQKFEEVQ